MLGFQTLNCQGPGLILDGGTEILQDAQCSQKKSSLGRGGRHWPAPHHFTGKNQGSCRRLNIRTQRLKEAGEKRRLEGKRGKKTGVTGMASCSRLVYILKEMVGAELVPRFLTRGDAGMNHPDGPASSHPRIKSCCP